MSLTELWFWMWLQRLYVFICKISDLYLIEFNDISSAEWSLYKFCVTSIGRKVLIFSSNIMCISTTEKNSPHQRSIYKVSLVCPHPQQMQRNYRDNTSWHYTLLIGSIITSSPLTNSTSRHVLLFSHHMRTGNRYCNRYQYHYSLHYSLNAMYFVRFVDYWPEQYQCLMWCNVTFR